MMNLSFAQRVQLPGVPAPAAVWQTSERAAIYTALLGSVVGIVTQQVTFALLPAAISLTLTRRMQNQQLQQVRRTNELHQSLDQLQQQVQVLQNQPPTPLPAQTLQQDVRSLNNRVTVLSATVRRQKHLTQEVMQPFDDRLSQLEHQLQQLQANEQQRKQIQQHDEQQLQALQQDVLPQSQPIRAAGQKLPDRSKHDRVAIFIDGSNLYHTAKEHGIERIDYKDLLFRLKQGSNTVHVYFYTGVNSSCSREQRFLTQLKSLGFRIVPKEVIQQPQGAKANLDVELALDMWDQAKMNAYDTAVLVSGDGDFIDLVQRVEQLGKRVELASFQRNTNKTLIGVADSYLDLTQIIAPYS
jgi:uncharacterized LabA/DUF88 family protein